MIAPQTLYAALLLMGWLYSWLIALTICFGFVERSICTIAERQYVEMFECCHFAFADMNPIQALWVAFITVTSTHVRFALHVARARNVNSVIQQTTRLTVLSDFVYQLSKLPCADHSARVQIWRWCLEIGGSKSRGNIAI
jgi:hypothetical protein